MSDVENAPPCRSNSRDGNVTYTVTGPCKLQHPIVKVRKNAANSGVALIKYNVYCLTKIGTVSAEIWPRFPNVSLV